MNTAKTAMSLRGGKRPGAGRKKGDKKEGRPRLSADVHERWNEMKLRKNIGLV